MTQVQKFRKKPVTIEAIQFTGSAESASHIIDWVSANGGRASWREAHTNRLLNGENETVPEYIRITTLEGEMVANVGAWIIRGIKGEFYPCDPEIFDGSYQDANTSDLGDLSETE